MPTIIWNRNERDVVKSGGKALVFATSADADTWLARTATKNLDGKQTKPLSGVTATTFDKITVT